MNIAARAICSSISHGTLGQARILAQDIQVKKSNHVHGKLLPSGHSCPV